MTDKDIMNVAIKEAKKGDFPFGAVIACNGNIIAKAHNTAGGLDPTLHAEINAIRKACISLNKIGLTSCTLYSTCEPCPMCFIAAWWAKVPRIVYGSEAEDIQENDWKIDIKCCYLNEKSGNRIKIINSFMRDDCIKLLEKK
jgi:guanine deaminase